MNRNLCPLTGTTCPPVHRRARHGRKGLVQRWAGILALAVGALLHAACEPPPDGGMPLRVQGTACSTQISYTSTNQDRIRIYFDTNGNIGGILVLDGLPFDVDDEAAWQSYTADNDTFMQLGFFGGESPTPHTIRSIFDSLLATSGVGVLSFNETPGTQEVTIEQIDLENRTVRLSFRLDVAIFRPLYPPNFSNPPDCQQGTLTGTIQGSYERFTFEG
jgi:hypothetical protein